MKNLHKFFNCYPGQSRSRKGYALTGTIFLVFGGEVICIVERVIEYDARHQPGGKTEYIVCAFVVTNLRWMLLR